VTFLPCYRTKTETYQLLSGRERKAECRE